MVKPTPQVKARALKIAAERGTWEAAGAVGYDQSTVRRWCHEAGVTFHPGRRLGKPSSCRRKHCRWPKCRAEDSNPFGCPLAVDR